MSLRSVLSLRSSLRELREIRVQLTRIADSLNPTVSVTPEIKKDDPRDAEITYRDSDMDWLKEFAKATGQKIKGVYDPNEEVPAE